MDKASNNALEDDISNISRETEIGGDDEECRQVIKSLHLDPRDDVTVWAEPHSIKEISQIKGSSIKQVNQRVKEGLKAITRKMGALNHGHRINL